MSPLEVEIDNANAIEFPDLDIALMAIEDKIIVMIDSWKSGYECKVCDGTGKVPSPVIAGAMRQCEECKGKGATIHIPDSHKSLPATGVIVSMGPQTAYCILKARIGRFEKQKRDMIFNDENAEDGMCIVFGTGNSTEKNLLDPSLTEFGG
jgi:hypothetical protein